MKLITLTSAALLATAISANPVPGGFPSKVPTNTNQFPPPKTVFVNQRGKSISEKLAVQTEDTWGLYDRTSLAMRRMEETFGYKTAKLIQVTRKCSREPRYREHKITGEPINMINDATGLCPMTDEALSDYEFTFKAGRISPKFLRMNSPGIFRYSLQEHAPLKHVKEGTPISPYAFSPIIARFMERCYKQCVTDGYCSKDGVISATWSHPQKFEDDVIIFETLKGMVYYEARTEKVVFNTATWSEPKNWI